VGFLADDEHPYAFVTLVERGGYGLSTSGPIVNNVLQWAVNNIDVE
jgi:cell division protein FtsI/penicillin-binding protein 2